MVLLGAVAGWTIASAGCGDDESVAVVSSSSTSGGGGGAGGAAPQTLCAKYGGPAAIAAAINQHVVPTIADDCRIGAFFAPLTTRALVHVDECLAIQAQELFECPGVSYEGSSDSFGDECRDMATAHNGLGISDGDFDALLEDVTAGLQAAGVSDDDIAVVAPTLGGLRDPIVEVSTPGVTREACSPGTSGAGGGGGAGGAGGN
jgi:hemoglobin